jgi:hypothetical protein
LTGAARLHAYALDPLVRAHAAALFSASPSPSAGSLLKNEPDTLIWAEDVGAHRRAVLKMYRHRGPVTTLRERTFRFRVQREFEALSHLQRSNIPCSEPIAWAHGQSAEHGRFEILATWEIAGAQSLRSLAGLTKAEDIRWDLSPLYRDLRRMHESGMFHGVLHLRNVLAGHDGTGERAFYIIDTPGAMLYPISIVGSSMARFDLLLFSSQAMRHLEMPAAQIPLEAYGADAPALRPHLAGFQPTRFDRQLIKAEAAVRLMIARRGLARMGPSYYQVDS